MSDRCEDCGREPWFANTAEPFTVALHCLAHTNVWHQMQACEARALALLRVQRAAYRELAEAVERAMAECPELHDDLCAALAKVREIDPR
jgi:hypothetical protein